MSAAKKGGPQHKFRPATDRTETMRRLIRDRTIQTGAGRELIATAIGFYSLRREARSAPGIRAILLIADQEFPALHV